MFKVLRGMLWGLVIGGIIALLFAPKSGKELREELTGQMQKLPKQAKDRVNDATGQLRGKMSNATENVRDIMARGKESVQERLESVQERLESVQEKMAKAEPLVGRSERGDYGNTGQIGEA